MKKEQVDLEKATIENYDETAESWAAEHAVINEWKDYVAKFKKILPSGKIIEVGCGGGRDAKDLIEAGYDYTGFDASAGLLKVAQKYLPEAKFIKLNMYDVNSLKTKYDGFWACASLLHIPKSRISEALGSIHGVLNPGAVGFISIKDGDKEEFEVREKPDRHEARLFVYWRKEEFENELKNAGYKVLSYEYNPVSDRTRWHVFFVKTV